MDYNTASNKELHEEKDSLLRNFDEAKNVIKECQDKHIKLLEEMQKAYDNMIKLSEQYNSLIKVINKRKGKVNEG